MAGPETCLFRDLAEPCEGVAREHVIPQCIGGTLVSSEVICDRCNHFFGDNIDPALAQHFEPIITQLAPAMRAQHRNRETPTASVDGSIRLVRRAGGVVELSGIRREHDRDGRLNTLYAPHQLANRLQAIAERLAPGATFRTEEVPVTDLLAEPLTAWRMAFTNELRRAVAKTALEVVDELARIDGVPRYTRTASLQPIVRFIRLGHRPFPEPSSPMANLGDEMTSAFRSEGLAPNNEDIAALSTEIAVIHDATASRVFALLSVARTMPLVVCLADGFDSGQGSWSLLVRRPLFPGAGNHAWTEHAAISWKQVEWARYVSTTNEAVLFARAQYVASFATAVGRAALHVDLTNDDLITETLRLYRDATGSNGSAVVTALQMRFFDNRLSDETWRETEARVDAENIGTDPARLLATFRRELQALRTQHGYPRGIRSLGTFAQDER